MTRYFALTLNANDSRVKTSSPSAPRAKSSTRVKNPGFWVMSMLFIFAAFYLYQVNSVSTKGYEIQKLEQRIDALDEDLTATIKDTYAFASTSA